MELAITSFFAGMLTALAPCVLPVLPVILAGSVKEQKLKRIILILFSLGVSIFLFTLLLKSTTLLIDVPDSFWRFISGFVIACIGLTYVFPHQWESLSTKLPFNNSAQKALQNSGNDSVFSPLVTGAALGPIFTSCSPTYGIIIATVLPQTFAVGVIYLLLYIAGLIVSLLCIVFFGKRFISKIRFAANPDGNFKKITGLILLIAGIFIMTGLFRLIEIFLVENNILGGSLLEQFFMVKM